MYHKIDIITPTPWWVTPGTLQKQLDDLRSFEFVYLDDYDPSNSNQVVLTFDDAYENVYHHAFPILRSNDIPFELFVIGKFLGDWNDFDQEWEPPTPFASKDQLVEMAEGGARIQWHTNTHPNLTELDASLIAEELSPPDSLRSCFPEPHLKWLSYPYGLHDERAISVARQRFSGAVSCSAGKPNDKWQLNRVTAYENSRFPV